MPACRVHASAECRARSIRPACYSRARVAWGRALEPEREAELRALEERLGYRFHDLALLDRALTHTSRANEDLTGVLRHNEALEFLGDAVLGLAITDLLHRRDPEGSEGSKSRTRAH